MFVCCGLQEFYKVLQGYGCFWGFLIVYELEKNLTCSKAEKTGLVLSLVGIPESTLMNSRFGNPSSLCP